MKFVEALIALARDYFTDKLDDVLLDRFSALKIVGLPVGALTAFAVVIGIHVASYDKYEDKENRERLVKELEHEGYRQPTVEHLWIGGLCYQAGHPYRWQAGRVHGTACIGDWRGLAVRGGSRWWPFGKPDGPERQ